MKKIKSILVTLFALTSFAVADKFPKGSPDFQTDYDAAMKIAKAEKKPLLVVFSATWCPPCQANKKNVYPSKAVQSYHDKFVWVYLDTDKKKNAKVANKFKVSGIPHVQFVKPNGRTIDSSVGGTSPKKFAKVLSKILKKGNHAS